MKKRKEYKIKPIQQALLDILALSKNRQSIPNSFLKQQLEIRGFTGLSPQAISQKLHILAKRSDSKFSIKNFYAKRSNGKMRKIIWKND